MTKSSTSVIILYPSIKSSTLWDTNIMKPLPQASTLHHTSLYDVFRCSGYYSQGNDNKWLARKMSHEGYPSTRQTSKKLRYYDKHGSSWSRY